MIVCNRCGKENQDHYKFCLGCGAELTAGDDGNMGTMKTMMADQGRAATPTPPGGVPQGGRLPGVGGPGAGAPPMGAGGPGPGPAGGQPGYGGARAPAGPPPGVGAGNFGPGPGGPGAARYGRVS